MTIKAAGGPVGKEVHLEGIAKLFGTTTAVSELDMVVAPGEFATLLGPSGSGKTTLLKLIAGFEVPSRGRVIIGGRDMAGVSVARRNIGMVFQNYALFPHMPVGANIAFPLDMRRLPKGEIQRRVRDVLQLVDLEGFEDRMPRQLSGGQQQRVALARALVFGPDILLMDEPLGALDKNLRQAIQLELKSLHRKVGVTVVYVTHDQEEALFLSDRILVMNAGRIVQHGSAEDLYERPRTRFVAGFIGECNLFEGIIKDVKAGVAAVQIPEGTILRARADQSDEKGGSALIACRPERLMLSAEPKDSAIPVIVEDVIYLGATRKIVLTAGIRRLVAVMDAADARGPLARGTSLWAELDPAHARIVARS